MPKKDKKKRVSKRPRKTLKDFFPYDNISREDMYSSPTGWITAQDNKPSVNTHKEVKGKRVSKQRPTITLDSLLSNDNTRVERNVPLKKIRDNYTAPIWDDIQNFKPSKKKNYIPYDESALQYHIPGVDTYRTFHDPTDHFLQQKINEYRIKHSKLYGTKEGVRTEANLYIPFTKKEVQERITLDERLRETYSRLSAGLPLNKEQSELAPFYKTTFNPLTLKEVEEPVNVYVNNHEEQKKLIEGQIREVAKVYPGYNLNKTKRTKDLLTDFSTSLDSLHYEGILQNLFSKNLEDKPVSSKEVKDTNNRINLMASLYEALPKGAFKLPVQLWGTPFYDAVAFILSEKEKENSTNIESSYLIDENDVFYAQLPLLNYIFEPNPPIIQTHLNQKKPYWI